MKVKKSCQEIFFNQVNNHNNNLLLFLTQVNNNSYNHDQAVWSKVSVNPRP